MNTDLKNEMQTLIIPLFGKAKMNALGIFDDPYAQQALDALCYDNAKLKIQEKTQIMLAVRAALMDAYARRFIGENPDCLVLHLGCGLDARFLRVGLPVSMWYDLDFPEVIDIRKTLFGQTASYQMIASSVVRLAWMEAIQADQRPVLVIAEGLLMYLDEAEIKALFRALEAKFGRCTILFDAYSKLTARFATRQPSLKKTGAVIKWGVDNPLELESYADHVKYVQTLYLTDGEALKRLPIKYRFAFKMAGRFKSAREAHRIILLTIGQ